MAQKKPSQMASQSWCTIESDPGVFTELISNIGVKGIQVEELYALEEDLLQQLQPVYGIIFLFKWKSEKETRKSAHPPNLFFANQVITNACATQAILSILLNIDTEKQQKLNNGLQVSLGEELTGLKNFAKDLDSESAGLAIGNSEKIRQVHNSFARPEAFAMEERVSKKDDDEDVFHFISFVPFENKVYELDGLKQGPIELENSSFTDYKDWISKVIPSVQERIQRYAASEIKFNLLAVVHDREEVLRQKMEQEPNARQFYEKELEFEVSKKKAWHEENIRRKHNYVPFLINLLKLLAEKGELQKMIQEGKTKYEQHSSKQ